MKKTITKSISLLTAVLMVLTAFSIAPKFGADEAYAASGYPAINLVTGGSAPNITGEQASSLYFGNYMQSSSANKEPIKWRVLEKGEKDDYTDSENPVKYNGLFLLADQNLDVMRYNESFTGITWGNCTMRKWLNGNGSYEDAYGTGGFLFNAFSDGEQSAIPTTRVVNADNPDYGTSGGNNTQDKVFLLSIEEAKKTDYGFADNYYSTDTRKATNTQYVADGGRIRSGWMNVVGAADFWWLRSPGFHDNYAAVVGGGGDVSSFGNFVDYAVTPFAPL